MTIGSTMLNTEHPYFRGLLFQLFNVYVQLFQRECVQKKYFLFYFSYYMIY
jgi:hypothetical protein